MVEEEEKGGGLDDALGLRKRVLVLLLGDAALPTQGRRTGHVLARTAFPRNVP